MLEAEFRVKPSCVKIFAVETWTGGLTMTYHCFGISIPISFHLSRLQSIFPENKKWYVRTQSCAQVNQLLRRSGTLPPTVQHQQNGCRIRASAAQTRPCRDFFVQPYFHAGGVARIFLQQRCGTVAQIGFLRHAINRIVQDDFAVVLGFKYTVSCKSIKQNMLSIL